MRAAVLHQGERAKTRKMGRDGERGGVGWEEDGEGGEAVDYIGIQYFYSECYSSRNFYNYQISVEFYATFMKLRGAVSPQFLSRSATWKACWPRPFAS